MISIYISTYLYLMYSHQPRLYLMLCLICTTAIFDQNFLNIQYFDNKYQVVISGPDKGSQHKVSRTESVKNFFKKAFLKATWDNKPISIRPIVKTPNLTAETNKYPAWCRAVLVPLTCLLFHDNWTRTPSSIKKVNPVIHYAPCAARSLNLVHVNTIEDRCPDVVSFFWTSTVSVYILQCFHSSLEYCFQKQWLWHQPYIKIPLCYQVEL